jgi:hypothetical protein
MTEEEARQRGVAVCVARLPMSAVLRTQTSSETAGFMKALVEATGDRILGFTILGTDAGEVIAAVQTAMLGRVPYTVLRDAILAHPTTPEGSVACSRRSNERMSLGPRPRRRRRHSIRGHTWLIAGAPIPKQCCRILGTRSLLETTLWRLRATAPPSARSRSSSSPRR